MPHLLLHSEQYGTLDMNALTTSHYGVQALPGASGLGLPPVDVKWREGAGDGATFRSKRVLPRELDIPIHVAAQDRERLRGQLSLLAMMLRDEVKVQFVDDDDTWFVKAHRIGGGSFTYGRDTYGETDAPMVLTMRSGSPYWTRERTETFTIRASTGEGLLNGSLHNLNLSSSQAFGSVVLDNPGDAEAFPVWTVAGPCTSFTATNAAGDTFTWSGTLTVGQTLTVDTRTGLVRDQSNANRYNGMASAPNLWAIPPGASAATVSLAGTSASSTLTANYQPRRWLVI